MPTFPIKIQESENIVTGTTITSIKIKVIYTGTIRLFVAQNKSGPWEEVAPEALFSGDYNIVTFSSSSTELYYRIVGMSGSTLYNNGNTTPAIYIEKLS